MKSQANHGDAVAGQVPWLGWGLAVGVVGLVVTYLALNWPALVDPIVGIVEVLLR